MPQFYYRAKGLDGRRVHGKREAGDEDQLYLCLRGEGLFLTWSKEASGPVRKRPLSLGRLEELSRQLAVLLGSGIPVLPAIALLRQREKNRSLEALYERLYRLVSQGTPLSDAMAEQGGVFPPLMCGLLRAGEESGRCADCARRLADYYERDSRLQKAALSALVYPFFLAVLLAAVMIAVFTVILPRFFTLFEGVESLPASTRLLIRISRAMAENGWQTAFLAAAFLTALCAAVQREPVRVWKDRLLLKLPAAGRLLRVMYTARFARTLHCLYTSGVPLTAAVETACRMLGNRYLERQMGPALEEIRNGSGLASALAGVDGFDEKLVAGIFVGEESGELGVILEQAAESFDYEAEQAAKRLTVLVEPVLIVLAAVLTGYVMLAVMQPVYQYYEQLG